MDSIDLSALLRDCLIADVQVNKPGNVSRDSAGHGMSADDFIRSADLVAPILCDRRHTPGRRIQMAVERTRAELGCNTNLGLILLCGPLVAAAEHDYGNRVLRLRHGLARVLRELRGDDGRCVLRAIHLAAPGGLGHSARFDVHTYEGGDVPAAMAHASARDAIAWQYCSIFHDIFHVFLPGFDMDMRRSEHMEKAMLACYIKILSRYPDSHIVRRHGTAMAARVRDEAEIIRHNYFSPGQWSRTTQWTRDLNDFDRRLKSAGINPGTSADLFVATLLLWRLSRPDSYVSCKFEELKQWL